MKRWSVLHPCLKSVEPKFLLRSFISWTICQLLVQTNGVVQHADLHPTQVSEEADVGEAPQNLPEVTVVKDEVIDHIVTVGKTKQKKRKRTKQKADGDDAGEVEEDEVAQGKKAAKAASAADITPFDYANAPNFLDTRLEEQSGAKAKRRQPKGESKDVQGIARR